MEAACGWQCRPFSIRPEELKTARQLPYRFAHSYIRLSGYTPGAGPMKLSHLENLAIQARMALIVGAKTFDRLFAGIRFDEVDGPLLYVYAKNQDIATEIEDDFSLQIAIVASKIIGQRIELVVVTPKVLQ
jgi:hypothetical protein